MPVSWVSSELFLRHFCVCNTLVKFLVKVLNWPVVVVYGLSLNTEFFTMVLLFCFILQYWQYLCVTMTSVRSSALFLQVSQQYYVPSMCFTFGCIVMVKCFISRYLMQAMMCIFYHCVCCSCLIQVLPAFTVCSCYPVLLTVIDRCWHTTEFHYVSLNLHSFAMHLSKAAVCCGNFVCPSITIMDCIRMLAYHETVSAF